MVRLRKKQNHSFLETTLTTHYIHTKTVLVSHAGQKLNHGASPWSRSSEKWLPVKKKHLAFSVYTCIWCICDICDMCDMCDMICTGNDFLSFHGLQARSRCQHEVSHEITCGVQDIMFGFFVHLFIWLVCCGKSQSNYGTLAWLA